MQSRSALAALAVACLLEVHARAQVTQRVSVALSGAQGNDTSSYYGFPAVTPDGRYVAFESDASNLVPGDTNGTTDVFVRDRRSGITERVSVDSGGVEADDYSFRAGISADGRFVVFTSDATNLVPGDTNQAADVFVRDRRLRTTRRVSVDSAGNQGDRDSYTGRISADGRFVSFTSEATNLVPGDTNAQADVFVRDRLLGTTERVSVSTSGEQQLGYSYDWFDCHISADGRYVTFLSDADNLVPGDTNDTWDVFLHDRRAGTTERISVDANGQQVHFGGNESSVSEGGRYVAFASADSHLVAGDTNGRYDIFVRDRMTGTVRRISVSSSGGQGSGDSLGLRMSPDGRFVAYSSFAPQLVPDDTNGTFDVFLYDRDGGPTFVSACEPGLDGVRACPCGNPPSSPERGCENSAGTGGARLSASGGTFLSSDSLAFTTSGEEPTATSLLLQGTTFVSSGAVYGQGVRCAGGALKRLFAKTASGGSVTAPDFEAGDPNVSKRSAAKGDVIGAGETRTYVVVYRDPVVLGGCPTTSTFNATQAGVVTWSP